MKNCILHFLQSAIILFILFIMPVSSGTGACGEETTPPPATMLTGAVDLLVDIPEPRLESLEAAVRDQFIEGRRMIEAIGRLDSVTTEKRARAYGELGQLYHAYELWDSAATAYDNALVLDPDEFEWLYSRAALFQDMGQFEQAISFYGKAIARIPTSSLVLIRLGECYRTLNNNAMAGEAFRSALQVSPESVAAMARLGELLVTEKDYESAVRYLTAALERQPAANKLHYPLAMAYRGIGNDELAKHHLSLRGVVGIQPPDQFRERLTSLKSGARVHLLAGHLAYSAGRFEEAAAEFRTALEAVPDDVAAKINLGTTLVRLGQHVEAMASFREAEKLEPTNLTAQYNLGVLASAMGDVKTAIKHLTKFVDTDQEDAGAYLELARVLERDGQYMKAFTTYRSALLRDAHLTAAWIGSSRLLIQAEQYVEAKTVLAHAHNLLPQDGPIAHALARLLAGVPDGDLRDGKRALDLALRVYAASATIEHIRTIAMAYAELGRCEEAITWQEQAVVIAVKAGQPQSYIDMLNRNLSHFREKRPCRVPLGISAYRDQKVTAK